ncbi:unnamed protein product (macronuclear) [Paramecium tetraurelia]|uniref:Chromosome undetermined scaffold_1, whole genome shotgun sequence n=1 Tax=Paramecium tetraurelia TaxID=5888 RepID=Q6BGH3_PARTE|nr:Ribonuclease P subunit p30 [Paramecium tetraurelia strain d4-2]XP_001423466.1 uncharacterized protein GSPATT00000504001 [Paramecium tetraurelia]CAH03247.1 Ribonuclease P subunit p30, putative [Paramecium tetraurelia]CAK56068.1 unnamed protein product [Paramecium tetraurelia]|eukprot:XP_001423466.1 hypothetical protein (macronuclear) [Paramecium tetraurelia strain d4-2]
MHSDLNLRSFYAGDPQKDNQLIQLLITCIEENYHNVAVVNYVKDQQIQKQNASTFKPYNEEFLLQKQQQSANISQFTGKIKQYSRLTFEVSDNKFFSSIKQENQFLQGYDIIAIKPKTEAVFTQLCTTVTYFDIITFDCFEKLPFIPKAKVSSQLLEKNIMFEINYGDAVQDPNKRRQFISNAQIIINATKGKNILLSSDTAYWLYHRSPYDLVALGITIGLKKDQATQAVGANAEMVIKHGIHRKACKGVICEAALKDIEYFESKKKQIKNKQEEKLSKKIKLSQEVYAVVQNEQ